MGDCAGCFQVAAELYVVDGKPPQVAEGSLQLIGEGPDVAGDGEAGPDGRLLLIMRRLGDPALGVLRPLVTVRCL
jgi:hypothetical protein